MSELLQGPQKARKKPGYPPKPVLPRLMARRIVSDFGCWVYAGPVDGSGYASISVNGKRMKVHRWMHVFVLGPIPDGHQVDHLCRTRNCFNPAHLEAVTPRENSLRSASFAAKKAAQTHCHNGHPLSGENLILEREGRSRRCRICKLAGERRRRAER